MDKKRDHLEIIHDILRFVSKKNGSAKPTNILYESNLSYQMLTEYLTELKSKNLIKEKIDKKNKKKYEITSKGIEFLKDYLQIRKFMDSYGFL